MSEVKNWQDFFNLTKQMREMQRQRFKTRGYTAAVESKRLERAVDEAIKTIEAVQAEHKAKAEQPNLFGGNYD